MKMKTVLSLVAAAVALMSHSAFAQDKSRAEVKEETKKAVKAGDIKAGEGATGTAEKAPKSDKAARAEVKGETKKAVKAGDIKAGEGTAVDEKTAKAKSTKARAEVKEETKKAVKEGTTTPAGEGAKK
jgi:cell division protein YceG involved in septum cleavage